MRFLVCEDDIIISKAIEHRLKNDGYSIDVLPQTGIRLLKRYRQTNMTLS